MARYAFQYWFDFDHPEESDIDKTFRKVHVNRYARTASDTGHEAWRFAPPLRVPTISEATFKFQEDDQTLHVLSNLGSTQVAIKEAKLVFRTSGNIPSNPYGVVCDSQAECYISLRPQKAQTTDLNPHNSFTNSRGQAWFLQLRQGTSMKNEPDLIQMGEFSKTLEFKVTANNKTYSYRADPQWKVGGIPVGGA
ncbi:MAG: hypothetical protein AAGF23_18975 [Acidobacteriota bacterium]